MIAAALRPAAEFNGFADERCSDVAAVVSAFRSPRMEPFVFESKFGGRRTISAGRKVTPAAARRRAARMLAGRARPLQREAAASGRVFRLARRFRLAAAAFGSRSRTGTRRVGRGLGFRFRITPSSVTFLLRKVLLLVLLEVCFVPAAALQSESRRGKQFANALMTAQAALGRGSSLNFWIASKTPPQLSHWYS